jgi:hypothetical protein
VGPELIGHMTLEVERGGRGRGGNFVPNQQFMLGKSITSRVNILYKLKISQNLGISQQDRQLNDEE